MTSRPKGAPSNLSAGFSLLELMVAMAVTLVITGAMFAMVTNAQTSFRREPALSDRQMQIRIAMDRIQEDLTNAGSNIGTFGQVFRENLNGVGPLGVRAAGDAALGGGNSDVLELRTQTPDCPTLVVPIASSTGPNYTLGTVEATALGSATWGCFSRSGFVLGTFLDGSTKRGWRDRAANPTGINIPPAQPADALSQLENANERVCNYRPATSPCTPAPAAPISEAAWRVANFMSLDVIRYQIANDTDGTPSLFRSTRGGLNDAGVFEAPTAALAQWQLVARGIEDFQVRYLAGPPPGAVLVDNAPTIAPLAATNYDNVVRRVEVTLWARTLGETRLQGETRAVGNGVTAVRGSLTTTITPRAALTVLSTAPGTNANRWQ